MINRKSADYILDKQRAFLRRKGFVWRAYLLAYAKESSELYSKVEGHWNDLHVITGNELAFVFANECASSFLGMGDEMRMERYLPVDIKYSIGESNSVLIERFREIYNIKTISLPCLVIENLISDNREPIFLKLNSDSDLISIMKYISIRTSEISEKILKVKNTIVSKRLRTIETYYDMKRRIMRLSVAGGESPDYVEDLFYEFERDGNSYAEKRLRDMWQNVVYSTRIRIFGDVNGNLINNLIKISKRTSDFRNKLSQFDSLISQVDELMGELNDSIRNIDLTDIVKDANDFKSNQIRQINDILRRSHVDSSFTEKLISDLNSCFDDFSEKKFKSIISRIHNSSFVAYIDDYGRILIIIGILHQLLKFLLELKLAMGL